MKGPRSQNICISVHFSCSWVEYYWGWVWTLSSIHFTEKDNNLTGQLIVYAWAAHLINSVVDCSLLKNNLGSPHGRYSQLGSLELPKEAEDSKGTCCKLSIISSKRAWPPGPLSLHWRPTSWADPAFPFLITTSITSSSYVPGPVLAIYLLKIFPDHPRRYVYIYSRLWQRQIWRFVKLRYVVKITVFEWKV